jgi:4-amino-4-deoxy-L-arabinose transferase-like glycosyltransferase
LKLKSFHLRQLPLPTPPWVRDFTLLGLLWLVTVSLDGLWLGLDQNVPGWDDSDHLTRALAFWRVSQQPEIFNPDWWHTLWSQSPSYRGPLVYLCTLPFLSLFGLGKWQAILVNTGFSALLFLAVYGLGRQLFSRATGLWAVGLCALAPFFAYQRTTYLLDYGLTAVVCWSFACLSSWYFSPNHRWLWAIGFGIGLGGIALAKPTGFLFLLVPGLWAGISAVWQLCKRKSWQLCAQLVVALGLALWLCQGWYRTNWLTIITSALGANAVGRNEGDPSAVTLAGWLHYGQLLPGMISELVVAAAIGGGVLAFWLKLRQKHLKFTLSQEWIWLGGFCLGAYLLCTLGTNKDARFILPVVPGLILVLAQLLTQLPPWGRLLRWVTVGIATGALIFHSFPLPGLAQFPGQHRVSLGPTWPHQKVVAAMIEQEPYLQSTLGVLPSTPQINHLNFSFYGAIAHRQVYGRQVGTILEQVEQDFRSLSWFLTQSDQLTTARQQLSPASIKIMEKVIASPEFERQTWDLPNRLQITLHHRRQPPITVRPAPTAAPAAPLKLTSVDLPQQAPPGQPIPVTYHWSGAWSDLEAGMVFLTWQQVSGAEASDSQISDAWFHDHGLGLGHLTAENQPTRPDQRFDLTEALAMMPPAVAPGQTKPQTYRLKGTYLNRQTGQTYPLEVPTTTLTLSTRAAATSAPELDLISQFQQWLPNFRQGKLEPIFKEIDRIHRYDPSLDYLNQLVLSLRHRLQEQPKNLNLHYGLALAQAIQPQPEIIQTCQRLTQLDPENPYAWAYLAFVNLYFWHPQAANTALQQVKQLNPNLPELKPLQAAAALMQFNLPQAWTLLN